MKDLPDYLLRAMLLSMTSLDVLPGLRVRILAELAYRALEHRRARTVSEAARAQAELRAAGHAAWLGLGGDS